MLVADVQFAACGRVLGYPGKLQQHFVQRRIVSLRQRFNRLVIHLMRSGADRRNDILAGLVKFFVLAGHDLRFRRRRRLRSLATLARDHADGGTARRLHATGCDDSDAGQGDHAAASGRCSLRRCVAGKPKQQ